MRSKGFTLIELLVVISIIGVLSSVIMTSVTAARAKGIIAAAITFDRHTYAALYSDLSASWDFDTDTGTSIVDQSGNGNTLILAGGSTLPTLDTTGTPSGSGKVLKFPLGATANTVPGSGLIKSPTDSFSVSLWIKTMDKTNKNFVSNVSNYPKQGTTGGIVNGGWRIDLRDSGNLTFNLSDNSNGNNTQHNFSVMMLDLNKWYNVVATCDSSSNKIAVYVNGTRSNITPNSVICSYNNFNAIYMELPVSQTDPNAPNPDYVDNVRIYGKALPVATVESLYLAEKPKFDRLAAAE